MAIPTRPTPAELPALAKQRPWLRAPERPALAVRLSVNEAAVLCTCAFLTGVLLTLLLKVQW